MEDILLDEDDIGNDITEDEIDEGPEPVADTGIDESDSNNE